MTSDLLWTLIAAQIAMAAFDTIYHHELTERLARWSPPPPRYTNGVFAKYAALVSSASEGAVTRAQPAAYTQT